MDEYIRLDTTIIGIDNLISKASTTEEANALFKAKDVIYSQQRCLTDVQPVKYDTELSSILQDYGIKDIDTLRYILDQYQKIIVDITGGQMSYLTYSAETVIACADDNYRKCYEESMKHGRWIIDYAEGTKIYHAHCSECGERPDRHIGGDYYIDKLSDFCPNCGARMDGDSDD